VKNFTPPFNYSHCVTARHSSATVHLKGWEGARAGLKHARTALLIIVLSLFSTAGLARQLQPGDPLHDYYAMLSKFWGKLYAHGGATLYCGRQFKRHKSQAINAEHVFPMSWVTRSLHCGHRNQCRKYSKKFRAIEIDMHNVWPALGQVNKRRSNFRPAIIRGERHPFDGCDFEVDPRRRIFEPRPAARGKVARSLFYMHDRYGLYLQPKLVKLLKKWNRKHPPGKEEKRRNDQIDVLQGNRNRFIDHAELIEQLKF